MTSRRPFFFDPRALAAALALLGALAPARHARADDAPTTAPAPPPAPPPPPPPPVYSTHPYPAPYVVTNTGAVYAPQAPAGEADDEMVAVRREPPRARRRLGPPLPAPLEITVGWRSYWHTDGAYRAFAASDLTSGATVAVGYEVATVADRVSFDVGFGYAHEASQGTFAASADGLLASEYLGAHVTARLVLLDWLLPHVRVGGGAVYHRFALETHDNLDPLVGNAWAGFAAAGAGLTLRTPSWLFGSGALRTVRLALTLEGGYQFASDAPVDLSAQPPTSTTGTDAGSRIATQPLHFGTLSASGGYFQASLALRF